MQLWNLIPENKHISFHINEAFHGNPTWNAELEILYVLSGSLTCTVSDTTYRLDTEDFLILNPYEIHFISSKKCRTISMFVFPALLSLRPGQHNDERIHCCSTDVTAPAGCYAEIRKLLANLFTLFYQENSTNTYHLYGMVLNLLSILEENFSTPRKSSVSKEQTTTEHMQKIVRYMDEHYMENLTLAEVAKTEFISANYLSHLFRNYLHTSFVQYLRMLRLNHAYSDLMNTNLSITDIAMHNGFSSTTAFIQYFRDMYGKTPAKFRKNLQVRDYYQQTPPIENEGILYALTRHATRMNQPLSLPRNNVATRKITADCAAPGQRRSNSWNTLMNVGWAKEALLAPVQQQILQASRELGFRMIRFHGIFDEDMYIYNEDAAGNLVCNFNYLEMLLDFLVSHELIPFIEFGFVPHKLASESIRYYSHHSSICLPSDLARWQLLVSRTLRHCINRYGTKEVLKWKFTLFNSVYVYYGCISESDWWSLWQATQQTVKQVNPLLQFGLNDDIGLLGPDYHRIWDYLESASANETLPDFLSLQCFYGDYYASGELSFGKVYTQEEMPLPHSPDENYLTHKLDDLDKQLQKRKLAHLPVWFEAWNSSVWQRDSCNDGCFKSAFLVKNILENEDRLQAFGHWTLSDFMEEVPHSPELFHGGYGILTYNGIPKAGYHAMKMLSALTEHCINKGNGWYITYDSEDLHILLYHYYHYDLLYQRDYSRKNDSIFKYENSISFQTELLHIPPGEYEFTLQSINAEHGSSYDVWLGMGAPESVTRDQIEYIKQVSKPKLEKWVEYLNGSYQFTVQLRAHEIQLITIHRIH